MPLQISMVLIFEPATLLLILCSGYIPHNGFATISQFISGTYAGLGMATDLAGFLAVYGSIVDGNGQGWSIGGVPHTGILGAHGNYETDSSPLKSDLNQYVSTGIN